MNKRRASICIIIMLISILLSSCGGEDSKTGEKLNIIDDNYRNYYEIFVYSFKDSDNDKIGDLNGVDQKLDYIKDMGFNGIWLMPVMSSDSYHKYDVKDYMSIDPQYGSIEDMKTLVSHAHEKDIRIIIDFVINHTSSKHPWFLEACEYLKGLNPDENINPDKCPYAEYYHFSKEKKDNSYYKIDGCEWYYEGSFWSEMPDLNLESERVREEFEKIASFWLEDIEVDGFRMDAAMHFEEGNTSFNTNTLKWLYDYCRSINPEFYMVSEVWASEGTIADYYSSETDSFFNFDAANAEGKIIKAAKGNLKAEGFVNALKEYETEFSSVYDNYIDAVFITNHDMGRVCNALMSDEESIKYAGGLLMSMNGSTFVYYGEEIGMKSKGSKDENKRLPMIWEEGVIDTEGPLDADKDISQSFLSVSEQIKAENSILNYYKKALLIRNQNPEIARGKITIDDKYTKEYIALINKEYDNSVITIIYNNSKDEEYVIDLSNSEYESKSIAGYLTVDNSAVVKEGNKITLPYKSIVYLK